MFEAAFHHDRPTPSAFNLQMVPIFVTLVAVQALLLIVRFLLKDVSGALTTLLMVFMGTLAVAPRGTCIHMGYAGCLGAVSFLQGLFDIAMLVEHETRPKMFAPLESHARKDHAAHMLRTCVLITCPLVELAMAHLCYFLYQDELENEEMSMLLPPEAAAQPLAAAVLQGSAKKADNSRFFKGPFRRLGDWLPRKAAQTPMAAAPAQGSPKEASSA
eukprot:TRINITY_DN122569_c0_g1_i1.p1 TRINITY_DN122569_c0_g1~~TRINITY_DN122569_c0_g1_i1.p1  ORF type:complete len:216 (-),score=37.92 TRINITY_DN122569_c0_g1_i1:37-684(-)